MDPRETSAPADPKPTSPGAGRPLSNDGFGKKHPYLIYLGIVGVLFVFLIVMGYLAVSNGWLPDRGIRP